MNDLTFSVAMSVYKNDRPEPLRRALESIISQQTVVPDEILLVVDGPIPPELDAVIDEFTDLCPALHPLRLAENGGLGNALRLAVENASHPLIARMDSDDIAAPDRFRQQLDYFRQDPHVDIVGGDISEFVGDEDNVVAYRRVPLTDGEIKEYLKTRCPLNHVSVMYKKEAVQRAGGYLDLFWNEDYYLWIRMVEAGAVMANTGTVLVNVRTGADMYSRRGGKPYFESELFLQRYMLERKMISLPTFCMNVLKRWIVQRLLPNSLRGWVFRTLARKDS